MSRVHKRYPAARPELAFQIPDQQNDQPRRQIIEPLVTNQIGKQVQAGLSQIAVIRLEIAVMTHLKSDNNCHDLIE